jgi:hypothetical protein
MLSTLNRDGAGDRRTSDEGERNESNEKKEKSDTMRMDEGEMEKRLRQDRI